MKGSKSAQRSRSDEVRTYVHTCKRCSTMLLLCTHGWARGFQSGLIEEVRTVSERTVAGLERAHRDALREQMLSEQRLREELLRWRHHHPEVKSLMRSLSWGDPKYFEAEVAPSLFRSELFTGSVRVCLPASRGFTGTGSSF